MSKEKKESETSVPRLNEEEDDFEAIINSLGGFGKYQMYLLMLFLLLCMFNAYVVYAPVLFLYVPDHWCKPDPSFAESGLSQEAILDLTVPLDEEGSRSHCHLKKSFFDNGHVVESEEIYNRSCPFGWEYNLTNFFTSAATDMNWVCEDSWKGPMTQSIFAIGQMVGTLIFGFTADHFGRLPTVFATNILLLVTGLATPFCPNFVSFSVIRFGMGLTFDSSVVIFMLLVLEFVPARYRSIVGTFGFGIGFTLGGTYIPWLLKYIGKWKPWHHALFLQVTAIVIFPWFTNESFRWYSSQGRADKCLKVLAQVAKVNGKEMPPDMREKVEELVKKDHSTNLETGLSWTGLFKTPWMRRNTILMILLWTGTSILFDGHIRNAANFETSFYILFTLGCAMELPSDFLAMWGLNNLGRRWSMSISHIMAALGMVFSIIFFDQKVVVTVMATFSRFWISYASTSGLQYQFEVFPTPLRSQGSALVSVFAAGCLFVAPYIAYSAQVAATLPFWILGAGGLVISIVALFLPESAGKNLPDTLIDAEEFGKDQKFFEMPLCSKFKSQAASASSQVFDNGGLDV